MGLVLRDVVVADAQRKVDRVEVFERGRQEREMERDEQRAEDPTGKPIRPGHAGCSNSPSLRLPMRYP